MASESEEYEEEYAYSSEEDGYPVDDEEVSMEWESDNPNAAPMELKVPAAVATKSGIRMSAAEGLRPEMNRRLKDVQEVLNVSQAASNVLLREHNWSKEDLLEAYMSNSDKIMKAAGIYARCGHQVAPKKMSTCEICYDEVSDMLAMPCGHAFCYECWNDFCVNAINDGPACVKTTCPQAGCPEVVTEEEMTKALGDASSELKKFQTYQLRSFVESNPLTRWCPGRGCERVACALSASAMESEGNVAHCDTCGISFCLVCGEEPHAPASCKNLAMWNKNAAMNPKRQTGFWRILRVVRNALVALKRIKDAIT